MRFSGLVSEMDESALRSVAAELLRMLDGGGKGTAHPAEKAAETESGTEEAGRRGFEGAAAELERRIRHFEAMAEKEAGKPGPAQEDETAEANVTPGPPAASERARAAFPATEASSAASTGTRRDSVAAQIAGGSDLESISEFFRRDSRRYDTGFGE